MWSSWSFLLSPSDALSRRSVSFDDACDFLICEYRLWFHHKFRVTKNFWCSFFVVSMNFMSSGSMKLMPFNFLALSSFGFSKAQSAFSLRWAAFDIPDQIAGHEWSSLDVAWIFLSLSSSDDVYPSECFSFNVICVKPLQCSGRSGPPSTFQPSSMRLSSNTSNVVCVHLLVQQFHAIVQTSLRTSLSSVSVSDSWDQSDSPWSTLLSSSSRAWWSRIDVDLRTTLLSSRQLDRSIGDKDCAILTIFGMRTTTFALTIRAWISDSSKCSSSSLPRPLWSFQILSANKAYQKNISSETFVPNWRSHWSSAEIGNIPTIALVGMIGASCCSPIRLPHSVFQSAQHFAYSKKHSIESAHQFYPSLIATIPQTSFYSLHCSVRNTIFGSMRCRWDEMRWDETMTARPPGKRSSMERQQTVDCTAICGTNKQTNESSPEGCRHHHWKQHTRQTAKTHSSRDVEMPPFWILVDYWQRCVTVVSQLKITSLCSEGGPPHWSTISELVLPRFNQIVGVTEVLDLVAFTVRHSTCPRVMAAAASLTAVASVPKLLLTSASALACSLVVRHVLSLWEIMFS